MPPLSVIIPAHNEEAHLPACLDALRLQNLGDLDGTPQIILAANACTDGTLAVAEAARAGLERAGWTLTCLDLAKPGKLNALNAAETQATGRILVYLDADVRCAPDMMHQLSGALAPDRPLYASGQLVVAPARSWITRHFARVWSQLPFMTTNVQGAGLFAVSRAGRARWDRFPDIIADDGFVRLQFAPDERIKVDATYHWPMVEGFANLVKTRRRQDAGVRELAALYPQLMRNESKPPMTGADHLRLLRRMPLSYLVYVGVMLAVKAKRGAHTEWTRGR